jgi:nickel superoxide dismutase
VKLLPLVTLLLVAAAPALPPLSAPFHCQVPCGIYGDQMRVEMLMEDCATLDKAMAQLVELEQAGDKNYNQIVRWVTTKDEHAQKIQQQCLDYWLAQRIKAPKADADEAATAKYSRQLQLMHGVIVEAMKCKQTIDPAHVAGIRERVKAFGETYFSAEDLQHLRGHEPEGGR